ncbi:MAG: dihydrofolate reductase [Mycoplasmoidaceae bacterium]
MLKAILCHDKNGGIGFNNKLPWSIKSEMEYFKSATINKTVVMGRKTFESMGFKPLKGRANIVLTKNLSFRESGVDVISDHKIIIERSKNEDIYIIGGNEIYSLFEDYIDEFIISVLNKEYKCNTYFNFARNFFILESEKKYTDFKVQIWIRNKKILNGRKVSKEIISNLKEEFNNLAKHIKKREFVIVQIGDDYASSVYINNKIKIAKEIGIKIKHQKYPETISQDDLINEIEIFNNNINVSAVLIQHPLPKHINDIIISSKINPLKDIDCFNPLNLGFIFTARKEDLSGLIKPCTPYGIIQLLNYYNIDITGKKVVILNRSNIVGKPLLILFLNKDASVSICHTKTKNIKKECRSADILVSAIGIPNRINNSYINIGTICIDVGINKVNGKITGDFDFDDVKNKCSFITPVPFGIGPMTIAILFSNFLKMSKNEF